MVITDDNIMKLLKAQNEDGLKKLFNRYYKPLVIYSVKFVDSLFIAEDIVQDFIIHMWKDKKYYNINESLKSYLFTSIRNSSIN